MSERVHILVIDDDALDRAAVRRSLKSSGLLADIAEAEDSQSAQEALAQSAFDCILLDYRLPGADGLEVLRLLRTAGVKTPIIMMTGQGDEQIAVEIMKAGATDYLAKGRMSSEMLGSSVRNALRIHRAEVQAADAESQRQHAEAALRQNERLLATTLRSIGDAVIATDAEGCVTFMNTLAEVLTGWSADEAMGLPFGQVLPLSHAVTREPLQSPVTRVLQSGTTVEIDTDTLAQARHGRSFPVVSSSAPIRGDHSAAVGVVIVFRDMTERVRNEERLLFLAEMSQLLGSSLDYQENLTNLAQLVVPRLADWCTIDALQAEGEIKRLAFDTNEQIKASLGSDLELQHEINPEVIYGPVQVIRTGQTEYYRDVLPEHLERLRDDVGTAIRKANLVSFICVPLVVRGDVLGAITFARTKERPHYEPDDVAFVEEVARRAAIAVDNALLYREAQDAIHIRDAFLSIAAHELKTPLTSLLGYTELLHRRVERGSGIGDRERRLLDVIMDQARRLNKMVMSMFDLSRLQMGQLSIEHNVVDVDALTSRIVKEIESTLDRHTLYLDGQIGQCFIVGDELRLEQVIQNLIQNAIKYSPEGGPIYVRLAQENSCVQISVQDRGLGIPHDSLPRIFRRFYRATNAQSHQVSGMGVGLYVAKQIIDMHGGRIEVESTEGEGSTFTIWLPLKDMSKQDV